MTADETRAFFEKWGYVRVPGAFEQAASQQMEAWMWERMRVLHGIERYNPVTWNAPWPAIHVTRVTSGLSPRRMVTPAFTSAADALLGLQAWELPKDWGGALISFPKPDTAPWKIASNGWHWDTEVMKHVDGPQNLFIFVVFSELETQGGGTLLLAGSHHLLNRFYGRMTPNEQARKMKPHRDLFKKSTPYLAALTSENAPGSDPQTRTERFINTVEIVDETPVQVVEIIGQPGDAFLCHPALFHAVSQNRRQTPRLMRLTSAHKINPIHSPAP